MTGSHGATLLGRNDPSPVQIVNPDGAASFLLIGDHAGNRVPNALGSLGVDADALARHIGWDIGIATLGQQLSAALDAPFIHQTYSRLVVDCNRGPDALDAIPPVSDGTRVPGNENLSDPDRSARFCEIHEPYQQAIGDELDRRAKLGQHTALVALHSFTPVMRGVARPWQIGVLHHGGNTAFAHAMLDRLCGHRDLTVGDNEPYRMDLIDYTVPRHAYSAGLPYVELEIRQDLLATPADCMGWSARLAEDLPRALAAIA